MMGSFPYGPSTKPLLALARLNLAIFGLFFPSPLLFASEAQEFLSLHPDETYSLGVNVELVNLNVVVRDAHGRYLPSLQKKDFKVYEDGVQQTITHFSAEDSPLSVALLLDTGTCLRPVFSDDERLSMMKSHALRFVRLLRPLDEVMVISFGSEVRMEARLTQDKRSVEEVIQQIPPNGPSTQLYRTVAAGLELMKREKKSRKAMVLFSFGGADIPLILGYGDGRSKTLRIAEEADVSVHAISLPFDPTRRASDTWQYPEMKNWTLGPVFLERLAAVTGGTHYWSNSWNPYEKHLTKAFAQIAAELGNQYGMAYVSSNRNLQAKFRKIKVEVNTSGAKARTRRGYFSNGTETNP
jgi:Ca-activated chloride channel homolog